MAIAHARISVGTTATLLEQARAGDPTGELVLVQNPDAAKTVYVGGPGVTTSAYGHALGPAAVLSLPLDSGEAVYGVVATGTATVNVLIQGQ